MSEKPRNINIQNVNQQKDRAEDLRERRQQAEKDKGQRVSVSSLGGVVSREERIRHGEAAERATDTIRTAVHDFEVERDEEETIDPEPISPPKLD